MAVASHLEQPTRHAEGICIPYTDRDNRQVRLTRGLLGLAPHRVYPFHYCLHAARHGAYLVSVALVLGLFNKAGRALPAMVLCGVRTFLPDQNVTCQAL